MLTHRASGVCNGTISVHRTGSPSVETVGVRHSEPELAETAFPVRLTAKKRVTEAGSLPLKEPRRRRVGRGNSRSNGFIESADGGGLMP